MPLPFSKDFDAKVLEANAKIQELFTTEEDLALFATIMLGWIDDVSEGLGVDLRAAHAAMQKVDHVAPSTVQ